MRYLVPVSLLVLSLMMVGCSSTAPAVDMSQAERVVGRENDVRVDAQLAVGEVNSSTTIPITVEVENFRGTPIAIAEEICATSYNPDTRTITIALGAEIPGDEKLPRLTVIAPGERVAFTAGAQVRVAAPANARLQAAPRWVQVKLNFLGDVEPFRELVDIDAPTVASSDLADELFHPWMEANEAVITNTLPIRWGGVGDSIMSAAHARPMARSGF